MRISPGMSSSCGEQERYFLRKPLMAGKWKKQLYQMEKSLFSSGGRSLPSGFLVWEGAKGVRTPLGQLGVTASTEFPLPGFPGKY